MNKQIQSLVDRGAIFYISHSGGKDSQAMYIFLVYILEIPRDQIVVVHADLGEIEHTGAQAHINATIEHPLNVVVGTKTFFEMVDHKFATRPSAPSFASPQFRECTSTLKRDPIEKFIRNDLKARGTLLAVNCTGIRAGESNSRKAMVTFTLNKRLSKAGREVHNWMPIHDWHCRTDDKFPGGRDDVFETISEHGQEPHPIYLEGNDRMSCVFCIMGSRNDFANGARLRPELLDKYRALELKTGYTMFQGETVYERAGLIVTDRLAA